MREGRDFAVPVTLKRKLMALLGLDEEQAEEVALKSKERRDRQGRRERDANGRVISKPFDVDGGELEPRRDRHGRRLRDTRGRVLDKPADPTRQRRTG